MQKSPSNRWYFAREDVLLGPVTSPELFELVAYGHLLATETIWRGSKRAGRNLLVPVLVQTALEAATVADEAA